MHRYGIPVGELSVLVGRPAARRMPGGSRTVAAGTRSYRLERFELDTRGRGTVALPRGRDAVIFVESGELSVGERVVRSQTCVTIAPERRAAIVAVVPTVAYLFSGPVDVRRRGSSGIVTVPCDRRTKYWGEICTIVNRAYAGKRLFFRKGQHSSLHYHCDKTETYFVHSGRLLVRLRAGRGEDRFFVLPAGSTLTIPRGLMHQDGGLEDTVIIEASTHDEDADSFIVEDGARRPMPRLRRR